MAKELEHELGKREPLERLVRTLIIGQVAGVGGGVGMLLAHTGIIFPLNKKKKAGFDDNALRSLIVLAGERQTKKSRISRFSLLKIRGRQR